MAVKLSGGISVLSDTGTLHSALYIYWLQFQVSNTVCPNHISHPADVCHLSVTMNYVYVFECDESAEMWKESATLCDNLSSDKS